MVFVIEFGQEVGAAQQFDRLRQIAKLQHLSTLAKFM